MKMRWIRAACLAGVCLVLLLACRRSVPSMPQAEHPAQINPALLQSSPTVPGPTVSAGVNPSRAAPGAPAQTIAPPIPSEGGEVPIIPIPLAGPISDPDAELSGMAWHSGDLILLPQYPERFGDGQTGAAFAISHADIVAFLDGSNPGPLVPREVVFIAPGIQDRLPGYEGFEAIAIDGDRVFLTIETRPDEMLGYLVSGLIAADNSTIAIDLSKLTPISPQSGIPNFSDEALLVFGNRLVSLYEANGAAVNPSPAAHLFDMDLQVQDNLQLPNVEYRITDATPSDENGRFWAINTFFPGDLQLFTNTDPLAEEYGEGPTHQSSWIVERLVQFQFSEDGIVLSETPPIQLVLSTDGEARNWEAISLLEGIGFLIATDRYPATILAVIKRQD